jgi:hypothetical protein
MKKDIAYTKISVHLFSQVDTKGMQYIRFNEISHYCWNNNNIDKAESVKVTKNRRKNQKKSTAGCDMEVEWKEGKTSALMATNAAKRSQYVFDNKLLDEPAFV